MKKVKEILIASGELGQLRYYEEVAIRLKKKGYNIAFCNDRDDPGVKESFKKVCADHSFQFYHHEGDRTSGKLSKYYHFSRKISKLLGRSTVLSIKVFKGDLSWQKFETFRIYHYFRLRCAKKILNEAKPDVIFTGEDGIASNYWLIHAAKAMKICVMTVPYGYADSSWLISKGVEEQHRNNVLRTTQYNSVKLIKDLFPKWVKKTNYGEAIFLPPEFILALEDLRIKIPAPWCLQGGRSDVICIENEVMMERYKNENIKLEKLKLTGSVYADVMYDVISRHERLHHAYQNCTKVKKNITNVLVCVPPSDHSGWGDQCSFKSVSEYIFQLNHILSQYDDVNVVYSFHPRMLIVDREELKQLGINDHSGFPLYLIPECDLFISCCSSMERWAIAARKIVINFDLYKFSENNFPDVPSYFNETDFKVFLKVLQVMLSDSVYRDSLVRSALTVSNRMGLLDGNSIDKIDQLLSDRFNS